MTYEVTPWTVKGNVDYDALTEKFGTQKIDENLLERIKKHTGELHHFLRRKIFFSHRDLNFLLDEYEKGNKFFFIPEGHLRERFIWDI
ncbi:Tryptophan--tRNA ligase (fragment) [groundwater metagenome]|uniref:Tryptophanyl-tRNA synthetase n=1 Tax=groundwater metagenome TaxID=717931 RepID=A0A098EAE0_9ZZZZ